MPSKIAPCLDAVASPSAGTRGTRTEAATLPVGCLNNAPYTISVFVAQFWVSPELAQMVQLFCAGRVTFNLHDKGGLGKNNLLKP
ncbi:hypothetical protein BJP37_21215 [Moorena bouillonii PNG]|uniref:Uncharacterized protein n=1 Tax=Moorena bouillonii PNG TaxID=568701 RepID=A0A1U7N5D0_9CYAN|nr:hypothetical protein BJP37_21215 [Moorena bouillonii PNG]